MAYRHMRTFSMSSIIRKMQIKTTMRYHITPIRVAISNKSTSSKCWWGCGEKGKNPRALLVECWLVKPLWRAVWSYLRKLKIELPMTKRFCFWDTSKETWNTNLKEYVLPYVHCSIIYNSQDLEAAQVSISRWVDKKSVVHLYNEILLGCKKKKKKRTKKRRKSYPLQQHGWTWKILCLVK